MPEWGFEWYQNLTYGSNVSINPFFYGNYLGPTKRKEPVRRSKAESYQCDSISAMSSLNDSHWRKMHKYRMEWEPGENGFLRWYIDDEFQFGIEQSSLTAAMETQVPEEPSYLIFNTAVSTSWGFPEPPPGCVKYDCKVADGRCGMNPGFCHSLPAAFLIDNVRVYQYKPGSNSSQKYDEGAPSFKHTVGCNPPQYPTKKYIIANKDKYTNPKDAAPLKKVVTGTGRCGNRRNTFPDAHDGVLNECGEGQCIRGECVCNDGWQGPRCLVPTYKNDFPDWDREEYWIPPLQRPVLPIALTASFLMLSIVFLVGVACVVKVRKRQSDVSKFR